MNQLRKTELGVATGLFLLIIFSLLYKSVSYNVFDLQHEYGYKFARYHQVFDYYKHYLLPLLAHITVVYLAFLSVNTWIIPSFFENGRWKTGVPLLLISCGTVFLVIMVASTWYDGYLFGVYKTVRGVHMHCAKSAFIITIFYATLYALYYAVRYLYFQQLHPKISKKPWFNQVIVELITMLLLLAAITLILPGRRTIEKGIFMFFVGLYFGGTYLILQYRLLPRYRLHQNIRILIRDAAFVCLMVLALLPLFWIMDHHVEASALLAFCFALYAGALLLVLPLSLWIFNMRQSRSNTILGLRKALDQSETGLDFLRWQINPHFLFNALNTLYGTALMEKASSTSEGIQKLGDMMRFMLHDNLLERISLTKEIAYLENYIALQRLRAQGAPDIQIEVNINDAHCDHEIAPMLLIPFLENAFKHGISLRSKSRITISLSCTPDKIYFDVYNTVHAHRAVEVEKDSMGIGLVNVRQRLALLYPDKHELNIRETATEYFVHLTIQIV
ncbi:sensor histidine kinase [Chitinophaga sp. CF418]|uniref:sensor histidine kinase n=1 Tax=Chitinophaga sp. CF418 TaxID=1855287 RepID=UPI000910CAA1|nr:histidine kinase [Chitinophaga sp. CF418]SHM22662.1 Histidine kinase [Chitinophaga sp. CF418]